MRATREFLTNASPSLPNRVYAIRLAPVMVDMNLPLRGKLSFSVPPPLSLSLSLSLALSLSPSPFPSTRLSCSRYFARRLSTSVLSFSRHSVLAFCPLFKVSFCSSPATPRSLSHHSPHFLSANLRCFTEKSKSPLAVARTGLQKRA